MLLCGPGPSAAAADNLDFHTGTLAGWENRGKAFRLLGGKVPAVTSSDRGGKGHAGILRFVFEVPPGTGEINFRAYAAMAGEDEWWPGDPKLNIVLAAAGKHIIPKQVKTKEGWKAASLLLPTEDGKPREYRWNVGSYVGRTVQIIIADQDRQVGSFVYCTGFHVVQLENTEAKNFSKFMVRLAKKNKLAPPVRYESKHFTALSNADDHFSRLRLNNCELIYHLFFEHFRRKGFNLRTPPARLMVAIFESQTGFEAYLGQKMPLGIVGIYHPGTNRLVVYDIGTNPAFVAAKGEAIRRGKMIHRRIDEKRYVDTVERLAREFRTGANIGTTMHEVAHQLSFNTGMLNRKADMPIWLAEGLACYCEATENDYWLGIGQPNSGRVASIAAALNGHGQLIPLRDLLAWDNWRLTNNVLVGYAQSWALFKMLMEEKPKALRAYLRLIYNRRTPDHRLLDFREIFGADLKAFELRYLHYLEGLAREHKGPNR
jgi:hypothetical protein